MHLDHLPGRLARLANECGLHYSLGAPAHADDVARAETRLEISLPAQVALFYLAFDGLRVEEPRLEIRALEQLEFDGGGRLHFCSLADNRRLVFDTARLNAAGQWDIVSVDGYRVTFTMASFWSNKIWAWIEKRRPIWCDHQVQATGRDEMEDADGIR